ncbi:hypothetical protein A5644_25810 [Mycobacterium intracellulare subsp. yongonense]|nr:hypothetical protein A5644_25810 [Mycobacterium intracellulare subsp. yongonense]
MYFPHQQTVRVLDDVCQRLLERLNLFSKEKQPLNLSVVLSHLGLRSARGGTQKLKQQLSGKAAYAGEEVFIISFVVKFRRSDLEDDLNSRLSIVDLESAFSNLRPKIDVAADHIGTARNREDIADQTPIKVDHFRLAPAAANDAQPVIGLFEYPATGAVVNMTACQLQLVIQ